MVHRSFSVVTPLLVLLLLVLPVAEASCTGTKDVPGRIFTPTGRDAPPPLSSQSFQQGLVIWVVSGVASYNTFILQPQAGSSELNFCILDECVYTPDFNVMWCTGSQFCNEVGHDKKEGIDVGGIPQTASWAVVYMRYGPDPGTGDGPLPWSTAGNFVLRLAC